MAFQPIVDIVHRRVWGYEALLRGPAGEGAFEMLAKVNDQTRYAFDQSCRVKAIELATKLFPKDRPTVLSINFLPNAIYEPKACLRVTFETAKRLGFPADQLMLEVTEGEKIGDVELIKNILGVYANANLITAIDDFGAGYAGLDLLADFQPRVVKIDMHLIRNIDRDHARQVIVKSLIEMANGLNIRIIAEGVETRAELETLSDFGVELAQGYYLAKPAFEALPTVDFSQFEERRVNYDCRKMTPV